MHVKVVAAIAAAAGLVAAGCGSGGQPLSRAELVQQANAICKRRVAQTLVAERGQHTLRAAFARTLPIAVSATRELEALKPPRELQATYERMIADEKAAHDAVRRGLASRSWNGKRTEPPHERKQLASALGLRACS